MRTYWYITAASLLPKVTRYSVADHCQGGELGGRRGRGRNRRKARERRSRRRDQGKEMRGRRGEIPVSSRVQDRYLGIPETFAANSPGVGAVLSETELPCRLCPLDTRADATGLLIRAKTA